MKKITLRERAKAVRLQVKDHRTGVGKRFIGDPHIDLSFDHGFEMGYRAALRDSRKKGRGK